MSKSTCQYCGKEGHPPTACPRVQSIEFHKNGTVKYVAFKDSESAVREIPQPFEYSTWTDEQKADYEKRLWTTGVKLSEVPHS